MADTFTFRSYSSTMADDGTIDFYNVWKHSDIAFHIDAQNIHASKLILSMWSPVFDAMFNDNFKEKSLSVIELPGKTAESFVSLMKVLHPPNEEICGKKIRGVIQKSSEKGLSHV